jgi:hypothetical protein
VNPGAYVALAGEVCADCPAGKDNVNGGECDLCAAGQVSPVSGGTCMECVVGKYSNMGHGIVGSTTCTDCAIGTYADQNGSSVCNIKKV